MDPRQDPSTAYRWILPRTGQMRVPGYVYASSDSISDLKGTLALEQVRNVAHLPGILVGSYAMPDIHEGYGFPIGGVAAVSMEDGAISPGGIGYDINCGVRVMASGLVLSQVKDRLPRLVEELFRGIPSGLGKGGALKLSRTELDEALLGGARWAQKRGYGEPRDLDHCEEAGTMAEARPQYVSERAAQRGLGQLGTLGSGNHFVEASYVSDIYDKEAAEAFGLFPEQVVFWVHTGSRGLGHQVCGDFLKVMKQAVRKYGISLPDRQLDCAPISSPEGARYLGAMAAAANYAWANRQILTHLVREIVSRVFPEAQKTGGLPLIYDVAHNIGKIEEHVVGGKEVQVLVHRKGATRAFPKGHEDIPPAYGHIGQPVLVPGDMGRASYIMRGSPSAMGLSFGSACHGAGRALSRAEARRAQTVEELRRELGQRGVLVKSATTSGLVEEAPGAYKDVDEVAEIAHGAGLCTKVARVRPVVVIKG